MTNLSAEADITLMERYQSRLEETERETRQRLEAVVRTHGVSPTPHHSNRDLIEMVRRICSGTAA